MIKKVITFVVFMGLNLSYAQDPRITQANQFFANPNDPTQGSPYCDLLSDQNSFTIAAQALGQNNICTACGGWFANGTNDSDTYSWQACQCGQQCGCNGGNCPGANVSSGGTY